MFIPMNLFGESAYCCWMGAMTKSLLMLLVPVHRELFSHIHMYLDMELAMPVDDPRLNKEQAETSP